MTNIAERRQLPALGDVARNLTAVVADPKTVFGIKLGLAGMLAVYLSQLIRLGHANWALFTVLVLAPAQYVGAIGPRATARVMGTIIGGFAGVWLVGNFEQDTIRLPWEDKTSTKVQRFFLSLRQ